MRTSKYKRSPYYYYYYLGVGRSPGIHASPVTCSILEGLARACKLLRDLGIHGVIWLRITELRSTEEGLERDEQDR